MPDLPPSAQPEAGGGDHIDRMRRAAAAAARSGIDALLVSPGPDLFYLTGYTAVPLERLTCLALPAAGQPFLVVPELEVPAALGAGVEELGLRLVAWGETQDPYALTAAAIGSAAVVAVDNHMWAEKTLRFAEAMPTAAQRLAGDVLAPMRARKSPAEVAELARAGAAIDAVHANMAEWLRPGRSERDVARDIAAAIIDAGHDRVDFVIVGSGPNGASPHQEVSDRILQPGDPVVVDIGGTTRAGYCSDETRTYCLGEPPADFLTSYQVLLTAQEAAVAAVRPGVACEEIDAVARGILADAGYGDRFIHRTGHGIGLQTHEEPYIVAGNVDPLEAGFAFSVEPGIYTPGRHGARIEDIVVCGDVGAVLMNNRPRTLQVIG